MGTSLLAIPPYSRFEGTTPTVGNVKSDEEDRGNDYSNESIRTPPDSVRQRPIPNTHYLMFLLYRILPRTEANPSIKFPQPIDCEHSTKKNNIAKISSINKEIQQLHNLKNEWAGENSVAPSWETITNALSFVAKLPEFVPAPTVTPADDGEIVLEWTHGSKSAVVSLEEDKQFGYAFIVGGKYRPGAEEGIAGNPLPKDLSDYLKSLME